MIEQSVFSEQQAVDLVSFMDTCKVRCEPGGIHGSNLREEYDGSVGKNISISLNYSDDGFEKIYDINIVGAHSLGDRKNLFSKRHKIPYDDDTSPRIHEGLYSPEWYKVANYMNWQLNKDNINKSD